MRNLIAISKEEQAKLIEELKMDTSIHSQRVIRLLDLPDLSRTEKNPVKLMVDKILSLPRYQDFDIIDIPEVVSTEIMFDKYNFPKDHPARSHSDTYYVNETHVLRPHTSIMRWYYLESAWVREKLEKEWSIWVISYGKVYRKDEIDKSHSNVFHNIDAIYIAKKDKEQIWRQTLEKVLTELCDAIYGTNYPRIILEDYNPYTDPTLEVEIDYQWKPLELLWSGVLRPETLTLLGIDHTKYNAWAWGPGIERLVMPKMEIPDIRILWSQDDRITSQWWDLNHTYEDVSKYPSTYRDISFALPQSTSLNNYYIIVRDIAWDLVEEVSLLDKYINEEKLGQNMISYTFRITYRSHDRTLTNEEINEIQNNIRKETEDQLSAKLR